MSNHQTTTTSSSQQQQQRQQNNRYAHIGPKVSASSPSTNLSARSTNSSSKKSVVISTPAAHQGRIGANTSTHNQQQPSSNSASNNYHQTNRKIIQANNQISNNNNKTNVATPNTNASHQFTTTSTTNTATNGASYYGPSYSFNYVDWHEQWHELREKFMDKVHEPQSQRRIILVIVCCALLLDNMLYMVIVPIIPDYLRSIQAWSTYAEGAKYVRKNTSGILKWERIGGTVVYEDEESAVGFLFASKAMVQLLINPFSGAIIDRIGYELPMMIGLVVMFFSTIVFACGQTYSVLFLARSLQGVGSAFADTSGLAMIADRFTEENERQRALGIALAFISFGCLVAPPFGAVLYQTAGKEVPFIILSLVCLVDGFLLLLVTQPGTFASFGLSFFQSLAGQQGATNGGGDLTSQQYYPTSSEQSQSQIPLQPPSSSTMHQQQQQQQQQVVGATSVGSPGRAPNVPATPTRNNRQTTLQRQKSTSRRQSLTAASNGKTIKGTPIYVLLKDPYIACCSGALIMANVSLAFLEPTISIWMQDTMPDIEEWQMGMIWLPAFIPHVLGVYCTVRLADKYPKYQWLIAAIGLALEGVSSFLVPFCSSFWSLIIPISGICFGIALVDTAILPTLGYLVDTRYVSVYGSIYAIADISYSLSYAIGPIIAGGIVEAIGFTSLNVLIAITNLGYAPVLMMLKHIHDYKPFEEQAGKKSSKSPLNPGGSSLDYDDDEDGDDEDNNNNNNNNNNSNNNNNNGYMISNNQMMNKDMQDTELGGGVDGTYHQQMRTSSSSSTVPTTTKSSLIRRDYQNPRWAASGGGGGGGSQANNSTTDQLDDSGKQHSVTIVEDPSQRHSVRRQQSLTNSNLNSISPKSSSTYANPFASSLGNNNQQNPTASYYDEDPWREDEDSSSSSGRQQPPMANIRDNENYVYDEVNNSNDYDNNNNDPTTTRDNDNNENNNNNNSIGHHHLHNHHDAA